MTHVAHADATSINRPAGGGSNEGPDVPSHLQMSEAIVSCPHTGMNASEMILSHQCRN